jgi:hypothetical protein
MGRIAATARRRVTSRRTKRTGHKTAAADQRKADKSNKRARSPKHQCRFLQLRHARILMRVRLAQQLHEVAGGLFSTENGRPG